MFVQAIAARATNATSITTAAISTTTGNLMVVQCAWVTFDSDTFTSITDSQSDTWTNSITQFAVSSIWTHREDYASEITGSATHTFTLTMGSSTDVVAIHATEVEDYDTSDPLDQTATGQGNTTNSDPTRTALTAETDTADELLIGSINTGNDLAWTVTSPWIESDDTANSLVAYQEVAATGQYRFTADDPGTGHIFTCTISTWRGAAGGAQNQLAWITA